MDYTWAGYASVCIKTAADFELGEEAELFERTSPSHSVYAPY